MRLLSGKIRPFLKWAGGKTQLLRQLAPHFPRDLYHGKIHRYVEPFIGGGAMFLNIVNTYDVKECIISDIHEELILCYQAIRNDVATVIDILADMSSQYMEAPMPEREVLYYHVRNTFNSNRATIDFSHYSSAWIERAAHIIFLNHTCFNGLFRFNSKGGFNVPFGKYKKPTIYEAQNLYSWADLLQDATILCGDFSQCEHFANQKTFYYFDPPYRPLNKTAAFTSYSRYNFTDADQKRLANSFRMLHDAGARLMLSNSDPRNSDPDDDFFDHLYAGFRISNVMATRVINSKGSKRGQISELVIVNY